MPLTDLLLLGCALGLVLFALGALLTSRKVRHLDRRLRNVEAALVERWKVQP